MRLIASVGRHWAIGYQNELLFPLHEDMRRFRMLTMGSVVVMGRKTLLTLPNAAPLPGRENIVLTRDAAFSKQGVHSCTTLEALTDTLSRPLCLGKEVFIIGGAEIYALLLPYASFAHLTHVHAERPADCFFPRLSHNTVWRLEAFSCRHEENGIPFTYATYRNMSPHELPGSTNKKVYPEGE